MKIVTVASGARLEQVRRLFEEYWASFGFTPCFQNFGEEVTELPGKYAPPGGDWPWRSWMASRRDARLYGNSMKSGVRPNGSMCGLDSAAAAWGAH